MKKLFFLSILAIGALVAGCSKSEVVDSKIGNDEIGFKTYLGRDAMTKAPEVTKVDLNNFGVIGFYTGATRYDVTTKVNLWNDEKVVASGNDWTYQNKKYWANEDDFYTFFAYAPHSTVNGNIAPSQPLVVDGETETFSAPVLDFTVADALDDQVDLLYSNNNVNVTKNTLKYADGTTATSVPFQFKHALARLSVQAKAVMYNKAGNKVDVEPAEGYDNQFTITNIAISGAFNTEGTFDLYAGEWIEKDTPADAPYDLTGAVTQPLTSNAYNFSEENNNYFMMIPTDFSVKSGEAFVESATITVSYKVTYAGVTSSVITKTVNVNTNFQQGKAYLITLTLQRDEENAITFTVDTVDDWGADNEVTPNNINA